jgi:hypothetical protein
MMEGIVTLIRHVSIVVRVHRTQ